MKKLLLCLIVLLISGFYCGCSNQNSELHSPANFYYPINFDIEKENEQIIQCEQRESKGYENNLLAFTDRYVDGPHSEKLLSIFPDNCYPVSITKSSRVITVYMSPGFSKLSGIDLTLACTCLSATLMDFTKADTVIIRVKDTRLDGRKSIVMTQDSFSLLDESFLDMPADTQN